MHRARRRRAAPLVPPPRRLRRGNTGHDRRRDGAAGGPLAGSAGVRPLLRRAMRLLHLGDAARRPGVHRPWRKGRPRGDPARARRSRLSLHRLLEDHRRRCRRRARRLVRPDDDGRREAHDDVEWRCRNEGRRRTDSTLRRRRARHRPDDVRRRRARPGNALGEGAAAPRTTTRPSRAWIRARPSRCPACTR